MDELLEIDIAAIVEVKDGKEAFSNDTGKLRVLCEKRKVSNYSDRLRIMTRCDVLCCEGEPEQRTKEGEIGSIL